MLQSKWYRCVPTSLLALTLTASAQAAPFVSSPGSLVVVRVSNGATLGTGAAAAYLDQYSTTGPVPILLNEVALPSVGGSALTLSAVGNHDGLLQLSSNGQYLMTAGYRTDAGAATTDPAGFSSAAVPRVIGRIGLDGSVNTTTTITDAYDGLTVRGAASVNGTQFYVVGDGSGAAGTANKDGVRLVNGVGGTTSTNLGLLKPDGTTPAYVNTRSASIFGGQLFVTSGSNSSIGKGSYSTNVPLPTAAPAALTTVSAADSTNQLVALDLSPTVGINAGSATQGVDTIYETTTGLLRKFSWNGSAWVAAAANATAALTADETLTASINATGGVDVFVGTATGIFRLTDTAGYGNGLSSTTFASFLTASGTDQFRGVAAIPEPASLAALGLAAAGLLRRRR